MNKDLHKHGVKFGSGQDPTKGGRPKGKTLKTVLAEILENPTKRLKELLPEGTTGRESLALELLSIAFSKTSKDNDKLAAIKEILDRMEGKAKQEIEQTGETTIVWKEQKNYDK